MFTYCGNNPISRVDPYGMFWGELEEWCKTAWNDFKEFMCETFGAGCTTSVTINETETPIIPDPAPITITKRTETTQTVSSHGDSSKFISVYADGVLNHPVLSSSAGVYINIAQFTLDISFAVDDIGISGSITEGYSTNSVGLRLDLSRLKVGLEHSTSVTVNDVSSTVYTNISVNGWTLVYLYLLATTGQDIPQPSQCPAVAVG